MIESIMAYKKRAPKESSKEIISYGNEDVAPEEKLKKLKYLNEK